MNKTADTNLRGIHAGKTGEADSLFLKKNCVAVGWTKMGDLSALKPDRDAFKARVAEVFPEKKPGAVPNNAGQLFRFVHEMKPGDLVAYSSKRDRQIHLGRVEGDYRYDPNTGLPARAGGEVAARHATHPVQSGCALRNWLGQEPVPGEELFRRVSSHHG